MKKKLLTFAMGLLCATISANAQTWDFTTYDETQWATLHVEGNTQWTYNSTTRSYYAAKTNEEPLLVGEEELTTTKGILFTAGAGKIGLETGRRIQLNGKDISMIVKDLKAGQKVTLTCKTASGNSARGFNVTNITPESGYFNSTTTEDQTNVGTVTADGDIVMTTTGGMSIFSLVIEAVSVSDEPVTPDLPVATTRSWDFTSWSEATKANLKTDASDVVGTDGGDTGWRAYEKASAPTDMTDKCYWYARIISAPTTMTANDVVIEELDGLLLSSGSITSTDNAFAIAIDNPSTSLGTYNGASYLWLNGSGFEITIPDVMPGATIELGLETHKPGDARGVTLSANGTQFGSFTPTGYEVQSFTMPTTIAGAADVVLKSTKGCHIYYITVTPPTAQTVEITATDGFSTYTSPVNLDFSGSNIKAYTAQLNADGTTATLTQVTEVAAGEGVLLYNAAGATTEQVAICDKSLSTVAGNMLKGTLTDISAGTYVNNDNYSFYVLSNNNGVRGFYALGTELVIPAGKAYLAVPAQVTNARFISLDFEGQVTGITNINAAQMNANKVYYNLNGQRVANPTKGLFILNGKKVLVK